MIVALLSAAVAYGSFRSELRLRSDMPVEFFDASGLAAAKRASERRIAAAYWNCAVQQVQWKYAYASRLPDDPPAEFSVSPRELGTGANDDAVRRRYWTRLRAIWNMSSVWKTQYEWSTVSFRQALRSAADWWGQLTRNLMGGGS